MPQKLHKNEFCLDEKHINIRLNKVQKQGISDVAILVFLLDLELKIKIYLKFSRKEV